MPPMRDAGASGSMADDGSGVAGVVGHGRGACANCGTSLVGAFCHGCGQDAHVHRTLASIGHDLLHGVYHFEGRIWRTLPMLVRHPGALTRRYIAGERTRFVSPLALFLFGVFLLFAAWGELGSGDVSIDPQADLTETRTGIERQQVAAATMLARLAGQRGEAAAAHRPTAALDARIAAAQAELAHADRRQAGYERGHRLATSLLTGWPWLDHGIARARANPNLVAYKVQSGAYKYSWALIPLSTPFVALLFVWRRRFGLYDHAIFVIYSIGFMTLLVVVLEVAYGVGVATGLLWTTLVVVAPVHMFAQLRGAYDLSVGSALWRTMLLVLFAGCVLLLYVAGVVAMGIGH